MVEILIVEDEPGIAQLIDLALRQNQSKQYNCTIAPDGEIAADLIEKTRYDLVLLDVMLPKIDGFELLEYIKQFDIPTIFITAKSDIKDKVKGLSGGADDYITKPFDISELQARVEVVLRRYKKQQAVYSVSDLCIDTTSRTVTKNGVPIELTLKEFEMLLYFLQNKNIALYREKIYEYVWNEPYMGDTRTVDLHVQRLRKKLGLQKQIQSVFKVGYRFVG